MKLTRFSVFVSLLTLFAANFTHAQTETGKIRFYETKQIRGEETYQITSFIPETLREMQRKAGLG